ncbi:DUF6059 family protein [Streptomyces sp. NPDC017993]|uniref:DUF6059 family protein n=1 Tax=Streptomyces sp. NPDC017993 TaxID=3365027 RepID=UPI00379F5477
MRWLRIVWESCQIFGETFTAGLMPADHWSAARAEEAREERERAVFSGPPPGHPERMCPEVPLSGIERRLQRELMGSAEWLPIRDSWC